MMDCSRIDELLVDYLYQELEPAQQERFEAHLQSCARCSEEVASFDQTRGMMQELPEEDPPPRISAFLLTEASQAHQPPAPGFWERLRQSLRLAAMHPAMTAAVSLVLVLGISFYAYRSHTPKMEHQVDLPLVADERAPSPDRVGAVSLAADETSLDKVSGAKGLEEKASEESLARPALAPQPVAAAEPALGQQAIEDLEPFQRAPLDNNRVRQLAVRPKAKSATISHAPGEARAAGTASSASYKNAKAKALGELSKSMPNEGVAGLSTERDDRLFRPARKRPSARKKARKRDSWDRDDLIDGYRASGKLAGGARQSQDKEVARVAMNKDQYAKGGAASQGEEQKQNLPLQPAQTTPAPAPKPAPARRLATVSRSTAAPRPADLSQQQKREKKSQGPAFESWLMLAEEASAEGHCDKAFSYYHKALSIESQLKSRIAASVRECAAKVGADGEAALLKAIKRYPRLASLLQPEVERSRRARVARESKSQQSRSRARARRKGQAEQQKKAAPAKRKSRKAPAKAKTSVSY